MHTSFAIFNISMWFRYNGKFENFRETKHSQEKVTECSRCTPGKPAAAARPSPRISPLCPYGGAGTQSSHFSLSSDTSEVGDVVAMMILGSLRPISISMPTKGKWKLVLPDLKICSLVCQSEDAVECLMLWRLWPLLSIGSSTRSNFFNPVLLVVKNCKLVLH